MAIGRGTIVLGDAERNVLKGNGASTNILDRLFRNNKSKTTENITTSVDVQKIDKKLFNQFKRFINELNTPEECKEYWSKEIKPLRNDPKINDATFDAIADYLTDRFDALESKQTNEGLNEASYGGVYDIADDQYFTKDDIVEFADNVVEKVNNNTGKAFKVTDVNMDTPTKLYVELEDAEHGTISTQIKIDFRKVRKPSDLVNVYVDSTTDKLISMI
jgi:hypothetical protein